MNEKYLQLILKWGKSAIKVAIAGRIESAHIDAMFMGESYSKETAVEHCLEAMDYLIETFANELIQQKIAITAVFRLKWKNCLATDLPDLQSSSKQIDLEYPPEIYFVPYRYYDTDPDLCKQMQMYSKFLTLKTPLNDKYTDEMLFSFYSCWRDDEAIKNNRIEYKRAIQRVFDPTGKIRMFIAQNSSGSHIE